MRESGAPHFSHCNDIINGNALSSLNTFVAITLIGRHTGTLLSIALRSGCKPGKQRFLKYTNVSTEWRTEKRTLHILSGYKWPQD
jgi:hypothetical protein